MTSSEPTSARSKNYLTWTCALSPFFLAFVWVSMAAHVRLGLGHWPQPMIEDYRTTAFRLHESALVIVGVFAIYIAVPLALILLYFQRYRASAKLHFRQFATYALGWLLILLLTQADPTSFTEWFLD